MSTNKISAATFCDFHGLDKYDRFVVVKKFSSLGLKTYDEWHEVLKNDINLGDKKDFSTPATAPVEVKPTVVPTPAATPDSTKK